MSGEKKRHRWRRGPILIEENLTIDSKLTKTTTSTEEEKHTENTIRKWYNNDEDDDNRNENEIPLRILSPNETISERIERVLRRINAWTNETSSTPTNDTNNNIQRDSLHDTSFNKTDISNYDNIRQRQQYKSRFTKPPTCSLFNSFRQRCCSSTSVEPNINQTHRPYSMVFTDQPLPPMTTTSCVLPNNNNNNLYEEEDRKVRGRVFNLLNEHG
jgi:hypothetical protein